MGSPLIDINGTQPDLVGHTCTDLVVEEYWHKGELDVPANVIWLHIDSAWHRLYFDCGIVFWRVHDGEGPKAYDMPELESQARLKDLGKALGVAGRIIGDVSTRLIEHGAEVALIWDSGEYLVFRHVDDKTCYYTG